jgi:hypothetical protein
MTYRSIDPHGTGFAKLEVSSPFSDHGTMLTPLRWQRVPDPITAVALILENADSADRYPTAEELFIVGDR